MSTSRAWHAGHAGVATGLMHGYGIAPRGHERSAAARGRLVLSRAPANPREGIGEGRVGHVPDRPPPAPGWPHDTARKRLEAEIDGYERLNAASRSAGETA